MCPMRTSRRLPALGMPSRLKRAAPGRRMQPGKDPPHTPGLADEDPILPKFIPKLPDCVLWSKASAREQLLRDREIDAAERGSLYSFERDLVGGPAETDQGVPLLVVRNPPPAPQGPCIRKLRPLQSCVIKARGRGTGRCHCRPPPRSGRSRHATQDVVSRPRIEMVVSRTVIGGPVSHGADVVVGLRFTRRMQVNDLLHPGDRLCPTKMSKGPAPLVAGSGPIAAMLLERRAG